MSTTYCQPTLTWKQKIFVATLRYAREVIFNEAGRLKNYGLKKQIIGHHLVLKHITVNGSKCKFDLLSLL